MSLIQFSTGLWGFAQKSEQVAYNVGLARVKSEIYERVLQSASLTSDPKELLSLDNIPSDYIGASLAVKRNNIILELDADTTLSYGRKLNVELIDVNIKVNQSNTIVSTALVGRRGTIKEYIQANDYKIDITGTVIARSQNAFPVDDVILLKQILGTPGKINVYSCYLELFGITQVVYKVGDFDQAKIKTVNQLGFSFQFESDDNYELEVL